MIKRLAGTLLGLGLLVGCSTKTTTVTTEDPTSPTYQGPPETLYCSTPIAYSSAATISGNAQYLRREPFAGGLGNGTTGGAKPAKSYPIRYAEVRVLNSGGTVVQCATTDNSGNYSFDLPIGSATYTIDINSRANNSNLVASVLNMPRYNQHYTLSTTVVANATKTIPTVTAEASGSTLGGAFNILDQLAFANDYLRAKAGNCSALISTCTNFTVAPKVTAYWTPGFNPNSYFGQNSSGLSFYLPDYSRLFILGGIEGDMDNSDTDHYDNSVIIHEYGHFLEDVMFASDSQGGSHNGNKVIDPRLAWSEGWGNFFQAAVLNSPTYTDPAYNWVTCQTTPVTGCPSFPNYRDTIGNNDGTTSTAFNVNLETPDSHDTVSFAGEGNFREFSVSRFLWDAIDTFSDTQYTFTDDISDGFVEIWASLTKSSNSFKTSNVAFRNIGLLSQIHTNLAGSTDTWANVHGINRHTASTADYAQYVTTTSGACSDFSVTPASVLGDGGSISTSDLFRNNDFYHLKINTAGTYAIKLDYLDADGANAVADLDLYLYNETARFGVTTDILTYSRNDPTQVPAALQNETVTMTLQTGNYLINVNVYTGGILGTAANYSLYLNGSKLCPDALVPL